MRAACNRKVDLVHRSIFLHKFIEPVGIDARIDPEVFDEHTPTVENIIRIVGIGTTGSRIQGSHIIEVILGIHRLQTGFDGTRHGVLCAQGNVHVVRAAATAFGGNVDHAVGSTRTVDRCGRCVLQNVDRLDIVLVERQKSSRGDRGAVEQNQRCGARGDRTHAVDADGRGRRELAVAGHYGQTGNLALESVGHVVRGTVFELVALDLVYRTDHGAYLTSRAVAQHHDILDVGGVLLQRDLQCRAACHGHFLGLIAQVGNDEGRIGRSRYRKLAFRIGGRSDGGAVHNDRRTDGCHAVGVGNRTGNLLVLSQCQRTQPQRSN